MQPWRITEQDDMIIVAGPIRSLPGRSTQRKPSLVMILGPLRIRKRWYQARARLGFGGYRVGSWQHAAQCVTRLAPMRRRVDFRAKVLGAVSLYAVCWIALTAIGMSTAWIVAATATAAAWLVTGIALFLLDGRCMGGTHPPTSGVREPRHPSPPRGPRSEQAPDPNEYPSPSK